MGAPTRSRILLVLAGAVLLSLGTVTAYGALVGNYVEEYTVTVSAPEGLSWTLWVPRPLANMTVDAEGTIGAMGVVETVHGSLANLTGSGNASVRYVFGATRLPWSDRAYVEVSGYDHQQQGYWAWRSSSDRGIEVQLRGWDWWGMYRLGVVEGWAGYSFEGALSEGWNVVRNATGWDGPGGIQISFVFGVGSVAFCTTGAASVTLAWHRRRDTSGPQ